MKNNLEGKFTHYDNFMVIMGLIQYLSVVIGSLFMLHHSRNNLSYFTAFLSCILSMSGLHFLAGSYETGLNKGDYDRTMRPYVTLLPTALINLLISLFWNIFETIDYAWYLPYLIIICLIIHISTDYLKNRSK